MSESPFDSDDDAFFAAIGRFTLAWGLIDTVLEVLVQVVYHRFGGRHVDAEAPRSLSRKIRFFARVLHEDRDFCPSGSHPRAIAGRNFSGLPIAP